MSGGAGAGGGGRRGSPGRGEGACTRRAGAAAWVRRQLRLVIQVAGVTVAASNGSWFATAGPVTADSVYNGESYDARKELPGWSTPAFAPSAAWVPATVTAGPGGVLTPIQVCVRARAVERGGGVGE